MSKSTIQKEIEQAYSNRDKHYSNLQNSLDLIAHNHELSEPMFYMFMLEVILMKIRPKVSDKVFFETLEVTANQINEEHRVQGKN